MSTDNNVITCKYLPYHYGNKYRFYPMVNVVIEGKITVGGPALIDSGATNTFIPHCLADAIGIIPEKKDKIKKSSTMGASGKFETSIYRLNRLQVFKDNHIFETFQDLLVYVSDNVNDPLPYIVLGRDYIFKHFDITFHENSRKMIFHRRSKDN